MSGHQQLSWVSKPTPDSLAVTSDKPEPKICCLRKTVTCHHFCPVVGLSTLCLLLLVSSVALSILYTTDSNSTPEWESLLFDYQNITDRYLTLAKANIDLRRDNEVLKKESSWLNEHAKLLNKTLTGLVIVNAALSLESSKLSEHIMNLTSTNLQLAQEHDRLVRYTSKQEEEKLNMSETIEHLVGLNTRQEEEKRRLSQMNSLLRDELLQMKERNQELVEINNTFQGEIKNLMKNITALSRTPTQEQNQSLSTLLVKEWKEAAEQERSRMKNVEGMEANMWSANEAYRSLDLYCPVVNQKTKERICRKCDHSWRLFQTKCYYFSSLTLTWKASRAWCQTQGGDLLVINSEPEQNFIFETSRALQQSGSRRWIGMTDAEVEGEWRWVDGSSVTPDVQFWLSRPEMGAEPDDGKLSDPLGEDCGQIDTSKNALKSWMNGSCKIPYRWICEKNV